MCARECGVPVNITPATQINFNCRCSTGVLPLSRLSDPHSGNEAPAEEVETNRGTAVPLVQQESNPGLQGTGALLSSRRTELTKYLRFAARIGPVTRKYEIHPNISNIRITWQEV